MLHLAAHILGNNGGRIEVDHLAHRGHHAVFHQGFHDLRAGFLHAGGQFAYTDLVGNLDFEGGLLGNFQLQAAHLLLLFLTALVGEGHIAAAAVVVTELFLALLHFACALAGLGTFGHVLQAFVVLIQIDVGRFAGVHDLGLGYAGGRRRSGGCRWCGGLSFAFGGRGLSCGGWFRPFLNSLRSLGRLLFRRCGGLGLETVGKNDLDAGDLIFLCQVIEDDGNFFLCHHRAVAFRRSGIFRKNIHDVLRRQVEALCNIMYFDFICRSQIKPPPKLIFQVDCLRGRFFARRARMRSSFSCSRWTESS